MHAGWWAERVRAGPPGKSEPEALRWLERFVGPVVRLMHRPTLTGVEHLPTAGAYLLVANHSGAFAASELLSLAVCWLERCGAHRPLAGMAHPFTFIIWPFTLFVRGVGAIPSTYGAAHVALDQGVPVLVFPGGDHEATRPVWRANTVTFGGRRGFLRVARNAGVPIVPMGIRGSHYSVPILCRSRVLAWLYVVPRVFGIKRMPLTVLGVLVSAAILGLGAPHVGWGWAALLTWAWLASPFHMLPWIPSTIRMRIGEPIGARELFSDDDDGVARAYDRIEGAVQALVAS